MQSGVAEGRRLQGVVAKLTDSLRSHAREHVAAEREGEQYKLSLYKRRSNEEEERKEKKGFSDVYGGAMRVVLYSGQP